MIGVTSGRCARAFLLALVAAIAGGGCAIEGVAGEFTALQCSDGRDNDGDALRDCGDPDCSAHLHCGSSQSDPIDPPDAGGPVRDAGDGGAEPPPAPPEDAATDEEPDAQAQDSGKPPVQEVDSGGPLADPPECDAASCDPVDPCEETDCPEPDEHGTWEITGVRVEVPRRAAPDTCLDANTQCSLAGLPGCRCLPDPWVIIALDGEEIDRTSAELNQESAEWEVSWPVALAPGDTLQFDVLDRDIFDDEPIYDCSATVDDESLEEGVIGCSHGFEDDDGEVTTFRVEADLQPVDEPQVE